jgi:hypothetical protein
VCARIAVDAGFLYGAQLPGTVYTDIAPLYFADQDWKTPDRGVYMERLSEYRPTVATVLDLETEDQFDEVMGWAEEAAQYVERVVVIPKAFGVIDSIPEKIGGKDIILGYSVPTKYAGTGVPVWEFGNRPAHLLGGSPHAQMRLCNYLNVVSADSNYAQRMAIVCHFWVPGDARHAKNRWFPTIEEADGERWGDDAPWEAFRRSCENIMKEWNRKFGEPNVG